MKKILDLQRNFSSHLFKKSDKKIIQHLPYSNLEALGRLNVYRNNVFGNFDSVVESIFEVTKKKLGAKKFAEILKKYHEKYPSKSGNLENYGDEFPQLLKKYKPAFLHDLSQLELKLHRAYFAKNVADFDVKKFQKLPQEKFFELKFFLHPSCFLFSSKFPIYSIWKGKKATKPESVLVARIGGEAEILKLTEEEFLFLEGVKQKKNLYQIYQKINRATKKECDIGKVLQKFIGSGSLSGFTL